VIHQLSCKIRLPGANERGAGALPGVRIQGELRHHEHGSTNVSDREIGATGGIRKHTITSNPAREIASNGKIITVGRSDQSDEALIDPSHDLAVYSHLCTGTTLKEHSHGRAG